jgi:hypothetical protein
MCLKKTTEDFIVMAQKIHGETYDYSEVCYTIAKEAVRIICREHGVFEVTPDNHIRRHSGCPKCANKIIGRLTSKRLKGSHHNNFEDSLSKRFENFLSRSKKIHGDTYDYSLVVYKNKRDSIKLICDKHGVFETLPSRHIRGAGCPTCAIECRKKKQDDFINEARAIHGQKYDYSEVSYQNYETKVVIRCPIHGEFLQSPSKHLSGHGCLICRESHGEKSIAKWLDSHNIKYEREKSFNDCVSPLTGSKLRFDFYIPERNTCIEFDGEQHFIHRTTGIFKGTIDKIRIRDLAKDCFCSKREIRLLRIPFLKIGNVNKILDKELAA